ncbi:MAG: CinA family nicotinamide mononucleotide deamidase-related protein [Planctomycetes bacterium]|nr:CinA family nicotinamide mononucleotide deamidase-related protein [Planctomycetota bacterium]
MKPRVAVIATGTELMRGRAVEAHLAYVARRLEAIGLEIDRHSACGDDLSRIVEEIRTAAARAPIVLLSGGLGPTQDDLTRAAAAQAFGRPLEFRPSAWRTIRARFRRFRVPMARINRRQAFFPRGARILPNSRGSAPGFALVAKGVHFFALPGPAPELRPMFERFVIPLLVRAFRLRRSTWWWEGCVVGLPEATVDERVRTLVARRPGTSYGLALSGGTVALHVQADKARSLRILIGDLEKEFGARWIGTRSLEETVADLLVRRRATIAVAESCTGGLVLHRLTSVPGISDVLREGWVTYSNASKAARLRVAPSLIRRRGAVSADVARAMARGAADVAGADVGVAVTGIAGPGGGSKKKPVGLVYHAVHYRGRTRTERRLFPGNRDQVKERAATCALDLVRRALLERGR